ncbi:MAG: hypothetical protein IJN27_04335 [Oscillospiraceae bacterium]|nr:hypothetical protein [Oscillospiraceae bacterium]
MNFDSVNYCFLLQDFVFAMAAGFAAKGISCVLSVFLHRGRAALWIRDMLTAFIFAAVVFSYVISFANYPDVRIYHLLGAAVGFAGFDFKFSTIFHKISEKILKIIKNKMLCLIKKARSIICGFGVKIRRTNKKEQKVAENTDLKNNNNWVYNL